MEGHVGSVGNARCLPSTLMPPPGMAGFATGVIQPDMFVADPDSSSTNKVFRFVILTL